jgi:hypothetical protein
MLRPNVEPGFLIWKKDLKNGTVQKKTFKSLIEYWVYRHRPLKKSLIELPNSTKTKMEQETPMYLHCIIVSKENDDHLKDMGDGRIFVRGLKFDNEMFDGKESKDLDNYLIKTKRK